MKVICIIGTRPEAIKMAPVVKALRAMGVEAPILATAQHRQLLDQVLSVFDLQTDWDLDAMKPNQNLSELLGRLLPELDRVVRGSGPDAILAQGDTTTVLAASIAAFHTGIPFGHVEAGLRSGDLQSPFPEEGNRRLASVLARWHFAPTAGSAQALRAEGIPEERIHIVGNTVVDALLEVSNRPCLPWPIGVPTLAEGAKCALVTLHRRESFGEPMKAILNGLKEFAENHQGDIFIYPVHPNPNVREVAHLILGGVANFHLVEPMDYPTIVNVLRQAYAVFTDSGGLQEESPFLGKPVLVFREVTERPEAVSVGGAILVGADPVKFLAAAGRLWDDPAHYSEMAVPRFPYGDGHSAGRIAEILLRDHSNRVVGCNSPTITIQS